MATAPPTTSIEAGRVLGKGFNALTANILPFLLAALLLVGLPLFLVQYFASADPETVDLAVLLTPLYWLPVGGALFAYLLGNVLLQAVLARSTILHLSGRAPDLPGSFMLALQLLLPLVGLIVCVGFLIFIGLLCLIVPGIMISCAFAVAVPALVEERRGVFASMRRSRELTRGSRLQIFLLLVLFWIVSTAASGILGRVAALVPSGAAGQPDPLLAAAAEAVSAALAGAISTAVYAALYVELREVKEGAGANELAAVFG